MSPRFGVDLNASNSLLTALPINIASSGSNTLIAGVAGQIIRVWKLFLVMPRRSPCNSLMGPMR